MTTMYTIISNESQTVPLTRIACLDLDSMGGVETAVQWFERNARSLGPIIVIAAVGRRSQNLTNLVGRVDGVIVRPSSLGDLAWDQALAPILLALEEPTRDDFAAESLPEEFSETMFQASLPDTDPRKRD